MTDHRCSPPDDEQGPTWTGRRDSHGGPIWQCDACLRWWLYGWPGFGGHVEDMAWLPMRDLFTGRDPATFDALIEADRRANGDPA
jgi:hypothetical protein